MRVAGLLLMLLASWFIWQHERELEREHTAGKESPELEPALPIKIPSDPGSPENNSSAVILERPLFSPQRRPAVATIPEPQPIPRPRIRLSAITISNSVRVAVVRELDESRTRHVREGDRVGDWVVEKVGRNSVILTVQEQRITIPLFGGD